jgi:hypothetical protein
LNANTTKKRKLSDVNTDTPLNKKLNKQIDEPDQTNTLSKFPEFYYYYLNALNQQQQQQQYQQMQQHQKHVIENNINGLKYPVPFIPPNYLLQPILNSALNVENFYKQTSQMPFMNMPSSQPNGLATMNTSSAAASLLLANYRNLLTNSAQTGGCLAPPIDPLNQATVSTTHHNGLPTPPKSSSSSSSASFPLSNLKSTYKDQYQMQNSSKLPNSHSATSAATMLLNKNLNIPQKAVTGLQHEQSDADVSPVLKKKIKQETTNDENILNEYDNNDADSNLSLIDSVQSSKLDTSSLSADVRCLLLLTR